MACRDALSFEEYVREWMYSTHTEASEEVYNLARDLEREGILLSRMRSRSRSNRFQHERPHAFGVSSSCSSRGASGKKIGSPKAGGFRSGTKAASQSSFPTTSRKIGG